VLLDAMLAHLRPRSGGTYIDATFGAGGYARAILEAAPCRVLAIDRDPAAIAGGEDLERAYSGRLVLSLGPFADLQELAREAGITAADGAVFDLGVSSMQLDTAARGFSFRADGPLDMRMSGSGPTAADLIATLGEAELADLLFRYGEERRSRAIARAIVRARAEQPVERTGQLAGIVSRVVPRRSGDDKHPATRTFQALRIAVNEELAELGAGLEAAERLLAPGGRLVVVSFHSLEDRLVKQFLAARAGRAAGTSRHAPGRGPEPAPSFRLVNRKPVTPGKEEIAANPRARSAKLRAAERTAAPPRTLPPDTLPPAARRPRARR
jgi:16S rRNA (cytosine1402-N4)-methyltransferase